jgi:hypothetical protein
VGLAKFVPRVVDNVSALHAKPEGSSVTLADTDPKPATVAVMAACPLDFNPDTAKPKFAPLDVPDDTGSKTSLGSLLVSVIGVPLGTLAGKFSVIVVVRSLPTSMSAMVSGFATTVTLIDGDRASAGMPAGFVGVNAAVPAASPLTMKVAVGVLYEISADEFADTTDESEFVREICRGLFAGIGLNPLSPVDAAVMK